MFRSQDHLQGATLFLAKVTFLKNTFFECFFFIWLYQGTVYLPEDDLRIETCWSDFKCFNVKLYICASVGVLIKWMWSYLKIPGWPYSLVIIGTWCVFSWQPFNIYIIFYNLYLPIYYQLTPSFVFSFHDGDLLHTYYPLLSVTIRYYPLLSVTH